jgi:hypothetical protein
MGVLKVAATVNGMMMLVITRAGLMSSFTGEAIALFLVMVAEGQPAISQFAHDNGCN